MDVVSILRSLPSSLLRSHGVQFSVKVYSALAAGDTTAFLRLHKKADWRQQKLMNVKLTKASFFAISHQARFGFTLLLHHYYQAALTM